jgi:hypothetical protein
LAAAAVPEVVVVVVVAATGDGTFEFVAVAVLIELPYSDEYFQILKIEMSVGLGDVGAGVVTTVCCD